MEAFGRSYSKAEQAERRNKLMAVLPFRGTMCISPEISEMCSTTTFAAIAGPVALKPPTNPFTIIEDIGGKHLAHDVPPVHVYFGLFITEGCKATVPRTCLRMDSFGV